MPNALSADIYKLEDLVSKANLPPDLKEKLQVAVDRLQHLASSGSYVFEYDNLSRYINWAVSFPWGNVSKDILDLKYAREVLDHNHYGLENIKERILEYLAVLVLNKGKTTRAPILAFVGLVGTGKTSLSLSIAQALGRKFARIPMGGLGESLQLRGQPRTSLGAEPGLLVKALIRAGTNNPVILLDEIDRVSTEHRSDIMGVLIEMLDPEQNIAFLDHYLDFPINLQSVLFIATANNTTNISTAVLDRLEVLQMPSYSDEDKITIGRKHLLVKAFNEAGIDPSLVSIDDDVWSKIVRPLGYDAGMRTLERTLQSIVRKIAKQIVVRGQQSFHLTSENIKEFLPVG